MNCGEAFGMYLEIELRRETNCPEHTQRVVGKGYRWFKRSPDCAIIEVFQTIKWVNQFSKIAFVQAYSQSINGKIATLLVVFDASAFNNRITAVEIVRFLACTYKFQFRVFVNEHSRTVCLENANLFYFKVCSQLTGKVNAITIDNNVDVVLARSLQKTVADVSANDEHINIFAFGDFRYIRKNFVGHKFYVLSGFQDSEFGTAKVRK